MRYCLTPVRIAKIKKARNKYGFESHVIKSLHLHVPQLFQTKLSISARSGSPAAPNIALECFSSVSLVHSYSCSETQLRCHFLQEALFNPQVLIGTFLYAFSATCMSFQSNHEATLLSVYLLVCIPSPQKGKFSRIKFLFIYKNSVGSCCMFVLNK